MYSTPLAYFITFSTYGSRLHGDERQSVIVKEDISRLVGRNDALKQHEEKAMKFPAVILEESQRKIVLDTILKHCEIKESELYAVHVRSNHVHVIVKSSEDPDKVMYDIKAWATRRLREAGNDFATVWTRQGSTKYIFKHEKLKEKIHYVIYEQGEMMAYYIDDRFVGGKQEPETQG